jgi:hypothetical protein
MPPEAAQRALKREPRNLTGKGLSRKGGRPKGSKDYRPKVQGAVVRALKMLDERGTPLSHLIADALQEDVVRTLHSLSRFLPTTPFLDPAAGEAQVVNIQVNLGPPPAGQEPLPQAVRVTGPANVAAPAQDTPEDRSPDTGPHRPPEGP